MSDSSRKASIVNISEMLQVERTVPQGQGLV